MTQQDHLWQNTYDVPHVAQGHVALAVGGLAEALKRWPSPRTGEPLTTTLTMERMSTPRVPVASCATQTCLTPTLKHCPATLTSQDGATMAAFAGMQALAPQLQSAGVSEEHKGHEMLDCSVETDGAGMPLDPQQAVADHAAFTTVPTTSSCPFAMTDTQPHGMSLTVGVAINDVQLTTCIAPIADKSTSDTGRGHVLGDEPAFADDAQFQASSEQSQAPAQKAAEHAAMGRSNGQMGKESFVLRAESCRNSENVVATPAPTFTQPSNRAFSSRASSPTPRAPLRETHRPSRESCTSNPGPLSLDAQAELDRCRKTLVSCSQALTPKDLRELRGFRYPPSIIKSILEATAILLGAPDTQLSTVRKTLQTNLPERLRNINLENVTFAQFRRLRKLLVLPDFNEEFVRSVCSTAVPLAVWCRAIGTCLEKTRSWSGSEINSSAHSAHDQPLKSDKSQSSIIDEKVQKVEVQESKQLDSLTIVPDITKLSGKELQQVNELVVSRPNVGSIIFHGTTDCTDLDIESLVHLDVGEVLVYPSHGTKPLPGQGLNKCATVTMYQCWPPNGRGHLEDVKAQERYREKIQKMTEDKNAKFLDYNCNTGIWKFQVEHF